MKNIHVLPTDKSSRLVKIKDNLFYTTTEDIPSDIPSAIYQYIYITSNKEIKQGDWFYCFQTNNTLKCFKKENSLLNGYHTKYAKIILTTDQDLIKDDVQAIDDEFLEWFVNNPSCEEVEVDKNWNYPLDKSWEYKIITPKEEQKQHLIDMMQGDEELGLYEEPKQENCCTPIGQIKRYIDCKGCDRKPKQEITSLEEAAERLYPVHKMYFPTSVEDLNKIPRSIFIDGAKWQQEKMYSDMQEYAEFCIRCYEKGMPCIIAEDWFQQFKQ